MFDQREVVCNAGNEKGCISVHIELYGTQLGQIDSLDLYNDHGCLL